MAEALRVDDRPALLLWADSDPALPFSVGERVSSELNFPAPRKIENAGHYLQEDAGAEIGGIIAEWLRGRGSGPRSLAPHDRGQVLRELRRGGGRAAAAPRPRSR